MSRTIATKGGSVGRATWSMVDQGISSLTNAVLSIVVARTVSPDEFGAFAIALLVFTFSIGAARAMISDPLVIRFSGTAPEVHRAASAQAAATSTVFGLTVSLLTLLAAWLVGDAAQISSALVALAIILPGLLMQDAWRFAFFSAGRPREAALNDLLWAVIQFGSIAWLQTASEPSVFALILCWGVSAMVAAVVGALQLGVAPDFRRARRWVATNRSLSWRLGADFAINQGAYNAGNVLVAPVSSVQAVGALSAARTVIGPLSLLFFGTTSFLLPTMVRQGRHSSLLRLAGVASATLVTISIAFLAFLTQMPDSWGQWLLGENWAVASPVLLATGYGFTVVGAVVGPALGLRARAQGSRILRIALIQAPLMIGLGVSGAWQWGAVGAAWGFGIAQTVGCLLTWASFVAYERTYAPAGSIEE